MQPHDTAPLLAGGAFLFVFALIGLASTIFWIVEIIDAAKRDFKDDTTKIMWILIIVFLHLLGALIYYFVGKNQGTLRT